MRLSRGKRTIIYFSVQREDCQFPCVFQKKKGGGEGGGQGTKREKATVRCLAASYKMATQEKRRSEEA